VSGGRLTIAVVAAAGMLAAGALVLGLTREESAEGDCGSAVSAALTPAGSGPAAYTMGLRVNQSEDVESFAGSALRERIQPRDVFVVNTEFAGGTPQDAEEIVELLAEKFPCNRIAALNGLGSDPAKPGYMYALADRSEVDAVLLDWEPDTWADAGQGPWTPSQKQNLTRIGDRLGLLAKRLESEETRMGLVPDYLPPWDYGRTGRVIARVNREQSPTHLGYQLVQTQPNCGSASAPGPLIGELTRQLRDQYRPLGALLLRHLGFEIAFDTTPNPKASTAVDRVGPAQAASCSDQILEAGGAGILYWATPQAVEAMLKTSVGRSLRPPGSS
jgi:hypothetical protein